MKAAFEIGKGIRPVMTLSEDDVREVLDLTELVDGLEEGFRALERGEVQSPPRPQLSLPGGAFSLAMMAWRPGTPIAVKVVNVFDGNIDRNLPNHLATITLHDDETGVALCVMDGTYITGIRTAATAALSARLLARADARVATVVGAGVQGREHLRVLPLVRDLERINVCSQRLADAEGLAALSPLARARDDAAAAVRESDVVCLATNSGAPVIAAEWIGPGTHVTSVGYQPPGGELPPALARDHRVFVEAPAAFEPPPVGCAELAGTDPARGATLGAVSLGAAPGRRDDDEVTVYKGMGIGLEDLTAADLAYRRARDEGRGGVMRW